MSTDKFQIRSELGFAFNVIGDSLENDDPWELHSKGLDATLIGKEGVGTTIHVPPASKISANTTAKDKQKLKIYSTDIQCVKRFVLSASGSLPQVGTSIEVATFLEKKDEVQTETITLDEMHYDKLWDVEVDPKTLLRSLTDAGKMPPITNEAEGRAFLQRYGYYYISKESYGGAVTISHKEIRSNDVSHNAVNASFSTRFASLWTAFGFDAKAEIGKEKTSTAKSEEIDVNWAIRGGDRSLVEGNNIENWRKDLHANNTNLCKLSYFLTPTIDLFARDDPRHTILDDIYIHDKEAINRNSPNWMASEVHTKLYARDAPLNVLVLGHKGAGKSSFINMIYNALSTSKWQDKCHTANDQTDTITKFLQRVDVTPNLRLFDFFGLDPDKDKQWQHDALKHVMHALTGNVQVDDELEFLKDKKNRALFHRIEKCKQVVDHYIHVVVFVIDPTTRLNEQIKMFDSVMEQLHAFHQSKGTKMDQRPKTHIYLNKVDKALNFEYKSATATEEHYKNSSELDIKPLLTSINLNIGRALIPNIDPPFVSGWSHSDVPLLWNSAKFSRSWARLLALRFLDRLLNSACDRRTPPPTQ